jgi:hypothetical protein
VGLGVLNPSAKLDVNGKAIFDSLVVMKDSVEILKSLRVKDKFKVDKKAVFRENVVVQGDIRVNGNSVHNGLLKSTGNVKFQGLTEATPNQILNSEIMIVNKNNGNAKIIGWPTIIETIYNPFLCPEDLNGNVIPPTWANASEVLYTGTRPCTGYPKVGIGLDNPYARLGIHVNENKITNAINIKRYDDASTSFKPMYNLSAKGEHSLVLDPTVSTTAFKVSRTDGINFDLVYRVSSKGELRLHTNTADVSQPMMIIDENDKKVFQVSSTGFLRTRRVRVDTETWPDYVFDENYQLRTLEETEKFILKNGHLPNVPKAEEVEEEGQDLGEMNKVLMEKVEELTLYLIEQNKRIKALESKLNETQK